MSVTIETCVSLENCHFASGVIVNKANQNKRCQSREFIRRIQICKFNPDCNLLLVLLGLMMMKSSKKWLTMSWLAEFLVGLLWSNLPLMTCYLRSCLSSIWAKKNLLPLALPAVKLVWKSEFFNWKKILPPFSLNLEPNFVKSASFNHSQHTNEPRYLKSFGINFFKSFSCSYSYSEYHKLHKGPSLYYVRVFWGFFEPPTHLRKDIFTT